ncbi:DUF4817 domain-containing protein [Trichonephila clavipes]|nr:DUF4817 domain-containing protein [Trichonephila clavipes]
MNRLTPEQRFQIVQFYFENNGSVRNTYRALRPFYRRQNRPSEQLIRLTMERFHTTFTLIDNSHPQRRRTVRTEEAIATVERSIEEDPNESIRHRAQELWFQQDGTTCHTARATIDLLKDTFDDRLISRFGPVNWPPRSCNLTPLDYFLWGYVKSLVYADKPQTLDHLEDNIRRVIADIRPQMLEKVIENWTSRLDYIRASRGSPMPEIIFRIHSPRGLRTRTRLSSLLRLNLDSSLKTTWFHSAAVQFPRVCHHSKRRHRWVGVKGNARNGRRDPKCPSARRLCMVREDTGARSEGATCAWMAADETVGCTRAFLMMWRSSRRLVCRGRPGLVFV